MYIKQFTLTETEAFLRSNNTTAGEARTLKKALKSTYSSNGADRIVNVFEIKYSESEYSLQKDEYLKIQNRIAAFKQETSLRSALFPTMMTTFGLKQNEYAAQIQKALCMNDLFVG